MTVRRVISVCSVAAALVSVTAVMAQAETGGDLSWALPDPAALKMLTPVGKPQQANADGLWELINGGAGIYLKAGFERVILQEYKSKSGVLYGLEVYQMKTPKGAKEVFGTKGGKQVAKPAIGQGSTLADYYGLIWQGRFFVTVTAYEKTDETKARLTQIARATVEKFRAAPAPK